MQVHTVNRGRLSLSRRNTSLSYLGVSHSKWLWNVLKYKLVYYLFSNCFSKYYDLLDTDSNPCASCVNGERPEVAIAVIH